MAKIGKFDIFAAYMYATGKKQGLSEDEAKSYGYSIAVLGAQAKMGHRKSKKAKPYKSDVAAVKQAASAKKKTTITSDNYDKHFAKFGSFYDEVFLPGIEKVVDEGLSYEDVKKRVDIPSTWGAKISEEQFIERIGGITKSTNKGEKQKATKKKVVVKKRTGGRKKKTKIERAKEIFEKMDGQPRKKIINAFIKRLDMSEAAANTYYYKVKN